MGARRAGYRVGTANRSHGGEPSCLDSFGKAVRQRAFPLIPATGELRFTRGAAQFTELATRVRELSGEYPAADDGPDDRYTAHITEELARLLPNREAIMLPDAVHQMWYRAPDV